jgi:hypothetical protein
MDKMGNEMVVQGDGALTVHELKKRVDLVQQAMGAVMRTGVHYGMIPGCGKPSLWKPGSELLLSMFRIAVLPRVKDLSARGEVHYRVICQGVLPNGEIVGEGVGECSSEEEKYKWRSAVCDAEYDDTADDRRRMKYTRDGKKFKQVRMNSADVANTILKMAKKRSQMDLTLTCTGASDVFTQDLEDLPPEYLNQNKGAAPLPPKKEQPKPGNRTVSQEQSAGNGEAGFSLDEEITELLAKITGGDFAEMDQLLKTTSHYVDKNSKQFSFGMERLASVSASWKEKVVPKLRAMLEREPGQEG